MPIERTLSLFGWCLTLADALCSLNEDSEHQHRHRNERKLFTGVFFCETAKSAKGKKDGVTGKEKSYDGDRQNENEQD